MVPAGSEVIVECILYALLALGTDAVGAFGVHDGFLQRLDGFFEGGLVDDA